MPPTYHGGVSPAVKITRIVRVLRGTFAQPPNQGGGTPPTTGQIWPRGKP